MITTLLLTITGLVLVFVLSACLAPGAKVRKVRSRAVLYTITPVDKPWRSEDMWKTDTVLAYTYEGAMRKYLKRNFASHVQVWEAISVDYDFEIVPTHSIGIKRLKMYYTIL